MKIKDDLIYFLMKQHYAIISTMDKNGTIHNSCKGIVDIDKQGKVCLLDLYKQRTYQNLAFNPNIALTVVDEHQFEGYSLKGKAQIISGERITEKTMKAWEKKITSRVSQRILRNIKGKKGHPKHPETLFPMPKYAIEMEVDSIVDLTPRALKQQVLNVDKKGGYMKSIKGTQTEKNLLASFAGESQARNRYTYFAGVAKKAGFEQIAAIFLETADNEKEHAKRFFKFLQGGEVEIQASYPAGIIGDTLQNLLAAAEGENLEWTKLYKEAEETARAEGFDEIAVQFKEIAEVEEEHEKRYRKLFKNIEDKKVFKKDSVVKWKCRNCGYVHEGDVAPNECPACHHPQSYYELLCENY